MTGKIAGALVALVFVVTNLLASCSSKNNETTAPVTDMTIQAAETTIPPAETITSTASILRILTAEPIAIKSYDADYMTADYEYGEGFSSIKDLCLTCHGPGIGQGAIPAYGVNTGGSQFPLPPTWFGSTNTPGTWQITPGSAADHTGRTNEECLYCHQAPH